MVTQTFDLGLVELVINPLANLENHEGCYIYIYTRLRFPKCMFPIWFPWFPFSRRGRHREREKRAERAGTAERAEHREHLHIFFGLPGSFLGGLASKGMVYQWGNHQRGFFGNPFRTTVQKPWNDSTPPVNTNKHWFQP